MFFKIVFENGFKNIEVLFENCSYYLNLVFLCFSEKKEKKGNQNVKCVFYCKEFVFLCFPCSCFSKQKIVFKNF